ncbi:DNA repair helicase XPB1-like protein [Tanacetum coccineum]|uniref:DNA repair helicase XPB1-like protein n=1 Tax=Tanacetum coccineum TaxID=301880 RepID=A0ABQ5B777_9ASTR
MIHSTQIAINKVTNSCHLRHGVPSVDGQLFRSNCSGYLAFSISIPPNPHSVFSVVSFLSCSKHQANDIWPSLGDNEYRNLTPYNSGTIQIVLLSNLQSDTTAPSFQIMTRIGCTTTTSASITGRCLCFLFVTPLQLDLLLSELGHWFGIFENPSMNRLVISQQTKKLTNLRWCLRRCPIFNGFDLGWIHVNAFIINHVSEELYFGNPKFTLGKFCIHTPLSSNNSNIICSALRALCLSWRIDKNIINNKTITNFVQLRQSSRCLPLEPSIGDNLTLGRSSSRHSTLEVGQISHQFLVADNGSSPFIKAFVRKLLVVESAILSFLMGHSIRCPCYRAAPVLGSCDLKFPLVLLLLLRLVSSLLDGAVVPKWPGAPHSKHTDGIVAGRLYSPEKMKSDGEGKRTYFTKLELKPDHANRPLWACADGRIFLETFSPLYKQASDFLTAIGGPFCRLESLHEYNLTPQSLYTAVSVGLETETIISVLNKLAKTKLPKEMGDFIHASTANYGKHLVLVLSELVWRTMHKEEITVNLIVGADPTIGLRRESKYMVFGSNRVDTIQLKGAFSTISGEYLLEFTLEYGILENLHPEVPGLGETIVDFPEGKRASTPRDEMPIAGSYSAADVTLLNTDRAPFQRLPENLLCLVGLSQNYYLGDDVYTTFLNGFVQPDPRVIDMEDPTVASGSLGTPSTIERSSLDIDNEDTAPSLAEGARAEDHVQEGLAHETPPAETATTT